MVSNMCRNCGADTADEGKTYYAHFDYPDGGFSEFEVCSERCKKEHENLTEEERQRTLVRYNERFVQKYGRLPGWRLETSAGVLFLGPGA